ncbi:autotransporter outer membrane beta-barrel domain-containing protein [Yersinia kristensenii]|uniref:autotransporter outer membrane beta-barrel domain-containing protein n=1 Tax=Yersinia kristensenii TaxID=28152 RepID=UPI0011A20F18|nr:autotransporter outer membrane beta-barrel domain-containing protein [Yersinia kristensenii]
MNNTHSIVLNGKSNVLPALSQFRLHPIVLACAAALALGATTFPVRAADCSINGTTYANCTQGQAGTSGINASGAEGTTGSNGNTAGNPTNAGTHGNNGGDATNTATSGGAGDVAATGGTLNVTTGSLLAGGAGGSGGNANGGNGGNGGWPVQGSNANGGNGGDAGLSGIAQNGGMGGNAIAGSGFTVNNGGSIFGGAGGAGGNALGGAGGRGGQGANNFGHSGDGGDGTAGGIAGNGAAGGIAVTGSHFDLVSQGIIRGGNGGGAGLATGGAAGSTDLAGAPGGTMGSAGQAGADGTAGSYGAGGVGVISTGSSTITTSNIIAGGLAGDRKTQANAIELSGGSNTLTLESGYSFVGNVISSGGDTLVLGGDTNSSFSVASLAASSPSSWTGDVQYYGFNNYVKTGNSTWTLSGSTTEVTAWNINAGTLSVSSDSNLGATESALTFGSGTLENTAVISTARDMLLNTSGTLKTDANLTAAGKISGQGSLVKTGTAALILTNNNTYAGGTTINAGTLQIGNGGTTGSVVGDITNNSALSFNRSDALTYGGVISGSGSLNQAGNDVLTLTGDNTFTGATTISAGTLQIGNGGTTGSVVGDIINNSALSFNRSDALTYDGVISGSGSVVKTGNDVLTLTGDNTFTGDTTISAGTLQVGNGGTTGAMAGNIINNGSLSFNRSNTLVYGGVISGSGSLAKAGNGVLILTGDHTFTGDTTISAGTLVVGNNTTGSVVGNIINNSTLVFNRSDALTYGGVISGSGSLNQAAIGVLTLTGDNTFTGGTTISAGTLQIGNGGTTGSVAGDIINNSALSFNRSDALTYSGVISGSGSVVKAGNDVLTLTGNNIFTGNTTINTGTLQIGNGGTTGSVVGDIINNSVLEFNRRDALAYGGVISGSGSVVQAGNGVLILTGNNAYSGGTVVNSGTLILQGVNAAGTGDITNNDKMHFWDTNGELSHNIYGTGSITFSGNSEVRADAEARVSAVNIDAGSKLTLLDSQAWQAGNGFSNAGTLVLSHQSWLLGNVDNSGVLALSNQQNVASFIDGNLTNHGSLVLNPSSTSAGNNLIINGDYVGGQGSSLSLGAVLADDNSLTDQLTILGNSSGTSTLYMVNEKGYGGQTLQGLKLITVQGTSDAVFTQGNRITAGLYDYSLVKKENDWYLDSYPNQIRPEAASYSANLQAANTLFTLSLHDRAGETQYEDLVTGETRSTSMWMRNEGGRSKVSMTDGQNNTNTNRYVLQLGGDVLQVSSEPMGKFNLGVMAGYANARGQTYNSLKGYSSRNTITGYSTGIYSSWYANDQVKGGLYADSWLQYNWFRNQVNGQEMAEEKYDSQGLTASLETGYDWLVNSWTSAPGIKNTLWLQPHAQAIWMGVKADGHTENQGSYVEGLGNNNVQTKLGLRAYLNGKSELDRNTERKFQPYVEANWVHNTHQYGVRIDGVDDHIKGARNAGELKTGVEAKLTERLSIQGGVSGQIGGNSYSDIAASLGGKFNF